MIVGTFQKTKANTRYRIWPGWLYLLLLTTLNFSCAENKKTPKTDTLKFTSGIRAIFQDSKGNYWFGSIQEGVAVFNGSSFTYFTSSEGLTDNQIHSIQEDQEGVIWFNTQTGVSSYDGTRIKNHSPISKGPAPNVFSIQGKEALGGEWTLSDKDLWFEAGSKEGVYRYDGQRLHYLAFPPHQIINPYENLFAATSLARGKNRMIWIATYAGVFGYDGMDFTIINDETLGLDQTIEALHIRSILEDSKGRLWIGNNGIGVLLKEGDSIINFSEKQSLIAPTSKRNGDKSPPGSLEHVFTIAEDHQGNIWFGDRDAGIWKYDGETLKNFTKEDGLSHDFVLSIYEDHTKRLWVGLADGKLFTFNGKTFEKQF